MTMEQKTSEDHLTHVHRTQTVAYILQMRLHEFVFGYEKEK